MVPVFHQEFQNISNKMSSHQEIISNKRKCPKDIKTSNSFFDVGLSENSLIWQETDSLE